MPTQDSSITPKQGAYRKGLRLYRVVTVLKLVPRFWRKSRQIARKTDYSMLSLFTDMLRCLVKYGASEENYEQYRYYEIDDKRRSQFVTWRRNMKLMYLFNTMEAKALFLDKVRWNRTFARFVKRDWICTREASDAETRNFLQKYENVVVKTFDGACGKGVRKLSSALLLSDEKELSRLSKGDFLIEEVMENIPEIRRFSPTSLNTLRLVTCKSAKTGKGRILIAVLRVGNGVNFMDNIHSDGIASCVDLGTGVVCSDGYNKAGRYTDVHPVSGVKFKGTQIPQWDEVVRLTKELMDVVPSARLVGWDIALTTKGIDVLEGNIPPGEDLTELDLKGRYHEIMEML